MSGEGSLIRRGMLFHNGGYSEEEEWVKADEYELLRRMHHQMCEIAASRQEAKEQSEAERDTWKEQYKRLLHAAQHLLTCAHGVHSTICADYNHRAVIAAIAVGNTL